MDRFFATTVPNIILEIGAVGIVFMFCGFGYELISRRWKMRDRK